MFSLTIASFASWVSRSTTIWAVSRRFFCNDYHRVVKEDGKGKNILTASVNAHKERYLFFSAQNLASRSSQLVFLRDWWCILRCLLLSGSWSVRALCTRTPHRQRFGRLLLRWRLASAIRTAWSLAGWQAASRPSRGRWTMVRNEVLRLEFGRGKSTPKKHTGELVLNEKQETDRLEVTKHAMCRRKRSGIAAKYADGVKGYGGYARDILRRNTRLRERCPSWSSPPSDTRGEWDSCPEARCTDWCTLRRLRATRPNLLQRSHALAAYQRSRSSWALRRQAMSANAVFQQRQDGRRLARFWPLLGCWSYRRCGENRQDTEVRLQLRCGFSVWWKILMLIRWMHWIVLFFLKEMTHIKVNENE